MTRRKFIKKSISASLFGGAVASSLFFPNIVSSKKKHTWVAVSAFDKAGILGRSFARLCDEITRISDGELNIRLFLQMNWLVLSSPLMLSKVELVKWDLDLHTIGQVSLLQLFFIWNPFWF